VSTVHDLRTFIDVLEQAHQLVRIPKAVSLRLELANVAATVARAGQGAVLFEHLAGSDWPVFAGGVASQRLAALALGCETNQVVKVMEHALEPAHGIPPQRVAEALWKQNVVTGDQVDLALLPIPTHAAHDGGAFITGGVTIAKDPVSGRGNLSYNRMQVMDSRTLGFNVNEWRHVMQFYKEQESKSQPLQIAIAIGLDPAIMIAAGTRYDGDELQIAGAIRGEGVCVSRGVTVDLDIPAQAEVVIEGDLAPFERHAEGPLAEFHGHYGELWNSPVLHVTAICHRDRAIYQTIVPGFSEHVYLGNVLPREPLLLRFVRHVSQGVTGLHIPPYGDGFLAIVQIKKSNPGEPKNVALAAMTAHVNIKQVIVVDPDVDIYDPADVQWALVHRVDWSRDVFTVPGAQGHEMDPTADVRGVHTKIGIDATNKPERRQYGERVQYPPVDLGSYLD
jgi:2,5-furandicarboxylate decarboxylase 1